MASGEKISAMLFGGIILGVWLYGLLFEFPDWQDFAYGRWAIWGLLGLLLAGAIYGSRMASDNTRLLLVVAIGVTITIITLGAILNANLYVFATLTTLVGGGLITMGLEVPDSSQPSADGSDTDA